MKKVWGDYEVYLDQVLGRGGMGAVYRGMQVSVHRPVAIKVLKKDLTDSPEFIQRFRREAALLAKLVDSHVVQVFGAGEADGEHFYAMEFIEGEDLSSKLKRGYQFSTDEILQVAIRTGKALQAAWKERIIHRDIKPSNIIVTKDNLIKVMDFGLAKNPEHDLTQTELVMGTAKYMSPEQATGADCDIRSDLYSLGAVLYELATGTAPFVGDSPTAVIYQHVHKSPVPPKKLNPSLPDSIQMVIIRLLAKQPAERYQSPDELINDCKAIQEGVTPDEKTILFGATAKADPVTAPIRPPMPDVESASHAGLYASLAGAVLIIGVAGYFIWTVLQTAPADDRPVRPPGRNGPTTNGNGNSKHTRAAWEDRYDELVRKGDDALSANTWSAAVLHWENALTVLPDGDPRREELSRKIDRAKFELRIDEGKKEPDLLTAIKLFEEAEKLAGDDAERKGRVAQLLRNARYRRYKADGDRKMGTDWLGASEDYKRALESADEGIPELEGLVKFCREYHDAIQYEIKKSWDQALKLFQSLQENPRGYEKDLEAHLKIVREEIAREESAEIENRRRKFQELADGARKDYETGRWAGAKEKIDAAEGAEYARFVTDEFKALAARVKRANSAPDGMKYVSAGKFRMGGKGRSVDGPEGDAEVAAEYYIDTREVTTGEYSQFLKALAATKGHHAGCPKGEPPEKKHAPDRWEEQKAGDPVTGVDWWDATSYAAWAGKRLPTEAEWERAASIDLASGVKRRYAWGDEFASRKGPSPFGCEGMDNGILEWTSDWFEKYPWSSATSADFGKTYKVLRGGFRLPEEAKNELATTYRHNYLPGRRARNIGFRCVKSTP